MYQFLAAIYAVSENGIIGKNNDLPWRLPGDMRFFMRKTRGHTVIMGRKSYESLGKPLPQRRNIVITRQQAFEAEGCEIAHSLEEALGMSRDDSEVYITGGAGIYREAVEKGYVKLIFETLVHAEVDGDVGFDLPHREDWEIIETKSFQADDKNEHAFTIRTLVPNNRVIADFPEKEEYAEFYAKYVNTVGKTDIRYYLLQQGKDLVKFYRSMSPKKLEFRYEAGKWTPKEVLGHIIDTERIMTYRALRIGRGDRTPMPGFNQDDYMAPARFNERTLSSLLSEFTSVRSATLSLACQFDDQALKQMGTASIAPVSTRALFYIIAGHLNHHQNVVEDRYL